ncbi:hypothetical protein IFM47457_10680 [Aspergillus lentulus]|nr:hypothetical protein IFM47457_10680 [Aspergillus lentulus]
MPGLWPDDVPHSDAWGATSTTIWGPRPWSLPSATAGPRWFFWGKATTNTTVTRNKSMGTGIAAARIGDHS